VTVGRVFFGLAALLVAALLAACASGPAPPQWRLDARGALEAFESAWLRGQVRVAAQEFARARSELASTGDARHVAQAELTRCALQVASLELDDCPGFRPLAQDAGAAARAYAAYLAADWQGLDVALLPASHRAVVAQHVAGSAQAAQAAQGAALAAIEDPLSRLVAAGALFRAGRIVPAGIDAAVDTASTQGWRRPLLAWLGVKEKRAQAAGDAQAAAAIRRRIELVLDAVAKR
jgi:hypothetical protein